MMTPNRLGQVQADAAQEGLFVIAVASAVARAAMQDQRGATLGRSRQANAEEVPKPDGFQRRVEARQSRFGNAEVFVAEDRHMTQVSHRPRRGDHARIDGVGDHRLVPRRAPLGVGVTGHPKGLEAVPLRRQLLEDRAFQIQDLTHAIQRDDPSARAPGGGVNIEQKLVYGFDQVRPPGGRVRP